MNIFLPPNSLPTPPHPRPLSMGLKVFTTTPVPFIFDNLYFIYFILELLCLKQFKTNLPSLWCRLSPNVALHVVLEPGWIVLVFIGYLFLYLFGH